MRVGITGGNGSIGSLLSKAFMSDHSVTVFDIRKSKHRSDEDAKKIKELIVDFSIAEQVHSIFENLDVVIHLAANPEVSAVRCSICC